MIAKTVRMALHAQQMRAIREMEKALFTIVAGAALITPAFAHEPTLEEREELVVTELRGSQKATMEIERDAVGVVDVISLSHPANFVLMYENVGFILRLASNWRDAMLSQANAGASRNRILLEECGQIDSSAGHGFNDNLSVSFEGLKLTEEDVRGRSRKQLWFLEDQGVRYARGARYQF